MQPETDPDGAWVAALGGVDRATADRAVAEARADRRLYAHLARAHAREGRRSYVEIDAPLELYALARILRPEHVVEVGVSSGVSSAYLLDALDRNGRGVLHSVDRPTYESPTRAGGHRSRTSWSLPPGRSSGWAVPPRLGSRWDLRLGDKRFVLPFLREQLPRIDLLVYDVPHACEVSREEFRALDPRFPPGGVAIVDHGTGGGLCPALADWARSWRAEPHRREGSGLFGARRSNAP